MDNKFPKIIYQTWFTKNIPSKIQESISHMLRMNPQYGYELSDDADMLSFIEENYDKEILDCFLSLKIGAAKADLWRYLKLYKTGGVYIDIDSVIVGRLDELISDDNCSIISRETNPGKFVQWCLMFMPNHPILKLCIDSCVDNIKNQKYKNVLQLTGPVVYSDSVKRFFNDWDVYSKTDEQVNSQKKTTGVRFHSFDYSGYAYFEHPNKSELYVSKPHWTVEQARQN